MCYRTTSADKDAFVKRTQQNRPSFASYVPPPNGAGLSSGIQTVLNGRQDHSAASKATFDHVAKAHLATDNYATFLYDAILLYARGLQTAMDTTKKDLASVVNDRAAVIRGMIDTEPFPGMSGVVSINEQGDRVVPIEFISVRFHLPPGSTAYVTPSVATLCLCINVLSPNPKVKR